MPSQHSICEFEYLQQYYKNLSIPPDELTSIIQYLNDPVRSAPPENAEILKIINELSLIEKIDLKRYCINLKLYALYESLQNLSVLREKAMQKMTVVKDNLPPQIIRPDHFIEVENAAVFIHLLNKDISLNKDRKLCNKKRITGLAHYLFKHGYFAVDKTNPRKSLKATKKLLMQRWKIKTWQEFDYKASILKSYIANIEDEMPVLYINERIENQRSGNYVMR